MEKITDTDIFLGGPSGEGYRAYYGVISCPSCDKTYFIDAREIRGSQSQDPQFQCNHCTSRFWVPYPEDILTGEKVWTLPVSTGDDFVSHPLSKPLCMDELVLKRPFNELNDVDADEEKRGSQLGEAKREEQEGRQEAGPDRSLRSLEKGLGKSHEVVLGEELREKEFWFFKPVLSYLCLCLGLACAVLIILGVTLPTSRNLVGIGVAGLFLSMAMYRFVYSL